jgi:asparagine synthase (glutamine-hydrolysing)
MCGICGVIQVTGPARPVVEPERLDWMTDLMTHRGPDDRGTYQEDGVALGVRRLSIIDVADGHQPLSNETGEIWAIQNGELYNHDELRVQLRRAGHDFRTRCDTEILPHLYETHGDDFPRHLRGDFAIAVWDRKRRRAVLARDRAGVKPLYYAHVDDVVVYASELKSILASGLVSPTVDPDSVYLFLTFGYVPGPRTLLSGVSKVLPGECLIVEQGVVRHEAYWRYPKQTASTDRLSDAEYREQLLASVDDSVRVRLMSDVPLGAMLSGGIDSSVVTALMAKHMTRPVQTFSVGFVDSPEANELDDARLVARALGTDHHELALSLTDDVVDLTELVWYLDEPIADLSSLGSYALCKFASETVSVALSGQGADELFGGYKKHRAAALTERWHRLGALGRGSASLAARVGPRRIQRPARTLLAADPVERHLAMSGRLDADLQETLLAGPLAHADDRIVIDALMPYAEGLRDEPLAASTYLDGRLMLVDALLHYFDHMSMAHSLEVRVPFLDQSVVELSASIPTDLKVRRLTAKHIVREAARGLIPDEIIDKPKIGFFRHAADSWFRAEIDRGLATFLVDGESRCSEYVDMTTVARLIREHRDGSSRYAEVLLAVLMLEVWLSSYLPRALGEQPSSREDRTAVRRAASSTIT